ncbi:MAG: hypothetical protein V1844_09685 [Pseudomonadota bacterium]
MKNILPLPRLIILCLERYKPILGAKIAVHKREKDWLENSLKPLPPGRSPGSVSVVLDTGNTFVGDLAMNAFPMCLSPSLPIFAEDLQKVKDSWKLIFDCGVKTIYPAHGNPFSTEIVPRVNDAICIVKDGRTQGLLIAP